VQRTIVVSLAAVFGLCGTAIAKPDWEKLDHLQGIRGEVRMKMQSDGRAGAQERGAQYNQEPRAQQKARPCDYNPGPSFSQIPLRTQIALKVQNEARPDGDDSQKSTQAQNAQNNKVKKDDRPGPSMAQLPLKTAIALKMQNGGEGKADDAGKKDPQQQAKKGSHISPTVNGQVRPLSQTEKGSLCKHTGVCLSDLMASDDPADKVE